MARITLDGIAHSYRSGTGLGPADYALKPLDYVWDNGGAYALLGPSGCGKTTLLNIVSGLIIPSHGRVLFDGEDVTRVSTERRNIAQVFQFPVIYDTMTVYENLAFPLRNHGMAREETDRRVRDIAARLRLNDCLNHRARGLTADVKQKVSLGRGLVRADVSAILFDEPLTVIDPHLKWQLRSELKHLHREFDFTMIYVTHDQTEALTFADKVVVMHDGAVVQAGRPRELFDRPVHTFVGQFIGSPGMNVLPAVVRGDRAVVAGREILLDRAYPEAPAGARVEIGIRPEAIGFAGPGGGHPVRVERIDDVGRYRVARLAFGAVPMAALITEGSAGPAEGEVRVHFDPARVLVYADGHLVNGEPR